MLGGRGVFYGQLLASQAAIFEMKDAIAVGENAGVMRDHDHRSRMQVSEALQEFNDRAAAGGVEGGSGLVRQQDGRIAGEGAGNRDALLLAATQVGGKGSQAILEADFDEEFFRTAKGGFSKYTSSILSRFIGEKR